MRSVPPLRAVRSSGLVPELFRYCIEQDVLKRNGKAFGQLRDLFKEVLCCRGVGGLAVAVDNETSRGEAQMTDRKRRTKIRQEPLPQRKHTQRVSLSRGSSVFLGHYHPSNSHVDLKITFQSIDRCLSKRIGPKQAAAPYVKSLRAIELSRLLFCFGVAAASLEPLYCAQRDAVRRDARCSPSGATHCGRHHDCHRSSRSCKLSRPCGPKCKFNRSVACSAYPDGDLLSRQIRGSSAVTHESFGPFVAENLLLRCSRKKCGILNTNERSRGRSPQCTLMRSRHPRRETRSALSY